jgi:predicted enzyme involved in methoxymalonyl-ACP biosynthesis
MISAVICRQTGQRFEVDTWIMSCRVLGRRVEETILKYMVEEARLKVITEIIGRYIRDRAERIGTRSFREAWFRPD